MKLTTLSGTNLLFASVPLQNRFQALLDEIIQQEEREMEQVKTLLQKRKGISPDFLTWMSYMCTHLAVIFKP